MAYAVSDDLKTPINLKDPALAAFLAWLLPGAGHLYQGRTGKGILYMVCILGAFFQGLYLGGGKCVYASTKPEKRLAYIGQVGVGLPALPALVQWYRVELRGEPPVYPGIMVPPKPPSVDFQGVVTDPGEVSQWEVEYGSGFELGTMYTVIAGLLNILVIFDAYGGPTRSPEPDKPTEEASRGKNARPPVPA